MEVKKVESRAKISKNLWVLSGKLRVLGELLSNCSDDPPLSEDCLLGLSHMLKEYAEIVDETRFTLDAEPTAANDSLDLNPAK